jgi:bud emergence protein 1
MEADFGTTIDRRPLCHVVRHSSYVSRTGTESINDFCLVLLYPCLVQLAMKALRKSLNGNKDHGLHHISTPIPIPALSKPSPLTPPNKVIRAIAEYKSQAPQQLSFQKGDFFHVLKQVDNQGSWYEAHNPMTGARGLVPRALFEEFSKANAAYVLSTGHVCFILISSSLRSSTFGSPKSDIVRATSPKAQVFYAVVLHDFVAERPDELDAKAGDSISVVAQSNREWFVAKPIGRLGRPGLIPVSFVEVRDPATNQAIHDVESLMDLGVLPKVEEWKRQMLNYKATSITLGVLDEVALNAGVSNSPYMPKTAESLSSTEPESQRQSSDEARPSSPALPEGILLSAEVVSFHLEMDEYWFRIHSVFQPFDPSGGNDLPPAKQHVLYRCYNDFYDFQIELLKTFPAEAGRESDNPTPRLIPYMPGPVDQVDNQITLIRKDELDKYLRHLCKLKETTARYILESVVVRRFLAVKPGDAEAEIEPFVDEINILYNRDDLPRDYGRPSLIDDADVLSDQMGKLKFSQQQYGSDGSDYGDRGQDLYDYHSRDSYQAQKHPYAVPNNEPAGSGSPTHRISAYNSSRSISPLPERIKSPSSSKNHPYATGGWNGYPSSDDYYGSNVHHRLSVASLNTPNTPSTTRSSQPSRSSRSRTYSNATNFNTPPISATNPQTAFVKIKIYDSVTDELIAIRVHPKVTHSQLMEKVQSRLGDNVINLRYRDSIGNRFVGLQDDEELRTWIETEEKHVLYAD